MSKECEKPRNVENIQCRNCDEYGHTSRDCPKPRDCESPNGSGRSLIADFAIDSRVQCQNCKEMGHTKVRCTKPLVEDDAAVGASTEGFDSIDPVAGSAGGGGDWNTTSGDFAVSTW